MTDLPAPLPRTVEGLTPQWLTDAIQSRAPGVSVRSMNTDTILWGTATKVLVDVQYGGDYQRFGIPHKLCIKGEFDDRIRLAGVTSTGTQIEAVFFNELAPSLGLQLPRHWYGGSEPGMGILVLDNLTAQGAVFGSPVSPWSADLVRKGLDILSTLHASTFKRRFDHLPWLQVGSPTVRMYNEFLMSDCHWRDHFVKQEVFQLPTALADRERILNALRRFWQYDDANADFVVHGDAHLGNACLDASGNPFFIDWAGPCYSSWAFDVSYFMVGAMTVTDRRAAEQDLLRYYVSRLEEKGGPHITWSDAWTDFRRHIMNGLIWTLLPPAMQPLENVHAMGERYAAALIDHDTIALLEA